LHPSVAGSDLGVLGVPRAQRRRRR
jgi:hypothetical protein